MVEIGHTFRAGWDACEKAFQVEGVPLSMGEFALQAAWDEYCGTSTPAPHPLEPDAFVNDWNAMVATISVTCECYNLRKPDMIFNPEWLMAIRKNSQQHISSTLVHMGVRVKFATFEQATVLREI